VAFLVLVRWEGCAGVAGWLTFFRIWAKIKVVDLSKKVNRALRYPGAGQGR
jgi:hypothetical protein